MTEPSPPPTPSLVLRVAFAALSLVLAGCKVGPNFTPPPPPQVTGYAQAKPSATAATAGVASGVAQRFEPGQDIPGDWWTLFHSQPLDALVEQALKNNHDLLAAQAALRVAHEDVLAQHGSVYPSVSAGFGASRQRASTALAPVPNFPTVTQEFSYSLFTPQVAISYAPDLFGLNRRTRESLQAQEQAARFQMIAVWTTLTSNVVVTAVEAASLRDQIEATRKLEEIEKQSLAMVRLRLQKGDATELDVAAQQTQLAQTEATLPPLVKQLAVTRHALAALVGDFPDQLPAEGFTLAGLHLPANLPLSLPSKLVAQRPDVRQARANLHAASAAIGIAAAARLPNIELDANAGSTALAISQVFTSGTGFWGIAASLTAPIFEGGALRHQELAAKDAYVGAAQQYRSTVLLAFENVADTLTALEQDAKSLQDAASAAQAAQTTLKLSQLQMRHGYISEFALLSAQQAYQQTQIALVQAQANRFADTAALYQALGGGWWHHESLAKK